MKSVLKSLMMCLTLTAAFAQDAAAPKPDTGWSGLAGASAIFNSGNSVNQTVGGNATLANKWDKNKVEWKSFGAYGRSEVGGVSQTNTKNWKSILRYDRFLTDPVSIFGYGHIGQDEPAGFENRFGGGAGLAHEIIRTDPNYLRYEMGLDYTREDRTNGTLDDIYSARTFLQYKRKISSWATFVQDAEGLFNLEEGKDIRVNTLSSLATKLTEGVAFQFGFGMRFDHQPVPGFKKVDTTTQAGLVVNFL